VLGLLVAAALAFAGCAGSYTETPTGVGNTTATARGSVFSTDDATISYWFEYGPTASFGSKTQTRSLAIADRDSHPVSESLSGLDPGTTYHHRICAKDQNAIVVCGSDRTFVTTGGVSELAISAPSLYPDFDPSIRDYVLNCTGGPVEVAAAVPAGVEVSIDGGEARDGIFTTDVPLQPNQSFSLVRNTGGSQRAYHVRCLPNDFPEWSFNEYGESAWQWYIVRASTAGSAAYAIVFDGHGVPVWWFKGAGGDAKYLGDGTLAWAVGTLGNDPRYEIRALDGTRLNTIRTVGTELDDHDLQLLPNGNYMVMSYKPRGETVNLTPYGGPPNGAVLDAELQEVDPDGDLVWSWNSQGHIGLEETGHWWNDFVLANPTRFGPGHDVVHINSVEVLSDSVVVSMRHTDAVYKIDRDTGEIVWKLGGTTTAESLTVLGDPFGSDPMGGQHDARVLADGTLTVHDNGTNKNRAPRAVRYEIDENAGTATLLESVSDPDAPSAGCCGSARRSESGSWVASWGGLGNTEHPVSEFDADGDRVFKLLFPGNFSYRANPVPHGELSPWALRHGMDLQYPR
jgi:hypothetical protein